MEKELLMSNVVLVCPNLSKQYFDINKFIESYKKVVIINWDNAPILGHFQFTELKTEVLFIENRIQIQNIPHYKDNIDNVIETCKLVISNLTSNIFFTAYGYNFDFNIPQNIFDSKIKKIYTPSLNTFIPLNNYFVRLFFAKDGIPYLLEINKQENQSILHINVHYERPTIISDLIDVLPSELINSHKNTELLIKEVFENV